MVVSELLQVSSHGSAVKCGRQHQCQPTPALLLGAQLIRPSWDSVTQHVVAAARALPLLAKDAHGPPKQGPEWGGGGRGCTPFINLVLCELCMRRVLHSHPDVLSVLQDDGCGRIDLSPSTSCTAHCDSVRQTIKPNTQDARMGHTGHRSGCWPHSFVF